MSVSKTDLVVAMSQAMGVAKEKAAVALDALVGRVAAAVEEGDRVVIPGLGTFTRADRKPRKGRDLRTGESLVIPACRVAKFSAARSLAKRLNPEVPEATEALEATEAREVPEAPVPLRTLGPRQRPANRPVKPPVKAPAFPDKG
ncbi:MAG: HU family DNA-binding protein [Deferrisomatales bacterium]|nr:HU family DNA-binding protein [Deferrisomatales bacterium]